MPYYTLADPAPKVGSTIGKAPGDEYDETYITDDPRCLSLTDIFDGAVDHETATDLALNPNITLIRVEPVGDITQEEEHLFTADRWTVTGIEPSTDAVLGPQAARIREVVGLAEEVLRGDEDPRAGVYGDAVNDRYDDTRQHEDAAEAALAAVGANGLYWTGCEYGGEVLALAARDLIGTTPEWTQEAYDALTEPWRIAMGLPAHPDDTAPIPTSSAA